jgi:anti-anti-sigma factor
MTTLLEHRPSRSIVEVDRALRAPVGAELGRRVQTLLDRGERRIVLDLSRLSDMDAAGVGELVRLSATTSVAGGLLQVTSAGKYVRELLHAAGVLRLLTTGADR